MKQLAMNYGKILYDLSIAEDTVMRSKEIFQSSDELLAALENPAVKETEKAAVIDLIFDKAFASFLKVVCENKMISNINEIFEAYDEAALENSNMLKATLSYVTKPTEEQIEKIKLMICSKYNKNDVIIQLKEDTYLIGGFTLTVGDTVYDNSLSGRLLELQKIMRGGEYRE